jgi:hypothetical protein
MYLDYSLGAPLLEPLFRLQASRNYTIGYAAADLGASHINVNVEEMMLRPSTLGSNYPSVSGINSNHSQGVERLSVRCWIWALLISPFSQRLEIC